MHPGSGSFSTSYDTDWVNYWDGQNGYEAAVEELEQVVEQLESGDLALEDSLAAFKNGAARRPPRLLLALRFHQLQVSTMSSGTDQKPRAAPVARG